MTTDQDSPSSQYWTSGQFFFFWGHVSRYCFSLMFTEGVGRILLWAGIVKRCMQVFAHDVIWYVGLRWVWPCCTGIVCSHLERMWCTTCKPVSSPVNINRHHTFINKSRKMCTPLYPLSFNPLLFDITQRKHITLLDPYVKNFIKMLILNLLWNALYCIHNAIPTRS